MWDFSCNSKALHLYVYLCRVYNLGLIKTNFNLFSFILFSITSKKHWEHQIETRDITNVQLFLAKISVVSLNIFLWRIFLPLDSVWLCFLLKEVHGGRVFSLFVAMESFLPPQKQSFANAERSEL